MSLAATNDEIARLTRSEREARVAELVAESHVILSSAIAEYVTSENKELIATALLYSGGNDSTTLAHIFRHRATHAIHANTGIGIEQTRQFVRDVCAGWGLSLIEKSPPAGSTYRELVLDQGFPGPGHHFKMYQRLKERCLRAAKRELVTDSRKQRIVFLAGRRSDESQRRANIPMMEREGSTVWVSPLIHWTKMDMNTYRLMHAPEPGGLICGRCGCMGVPRNEVSDLIHMSGECLCGSFAHQGELEEVGTWFPEVRSDIEALEAEVLATGKHPDWKCRWGWGADKAAIDKARKSGLSDAEVAELFTRSTSGPLCTSCDSKPGGGEVIANNGHSGVV